ncbi:4-hydroxy-3-methylbut-2-enyl diphosphate reductase [Fundidesulfovibrio magnetotacticus]|uniref:4-hydroxy-3-methylbut-2-enyl diphosphate reductase n=1 Tax=Fundidesulfovibrio magnetotacticus TaxID=2730080 RepID=A0A6V8M1P6_9BACT|nr:4-hydroxy-3-methylbut-2-enyl diphosphate reductase [Fundidesulfovibrio magnetotacticus]GFK95866.1 4-hydroxy-3-methylbut-2-enyl diphosphate reductase [Fundidesulfovibrio magnetotacticus]
MDVLRAETAGFCMGVDLALRKLDKLLAGNASEAPIYTFGPLIHNPQVLREYAQRGVRLCEDPEVIEPGAVVLIRAHGVPKGVFERLRARGAIIADATCPKVTKAQKLIARQADEGGILLLYGEEAHPEVRGLLSHASHGAIIFDSLAELQGHTLDRADSYFLAAQTTQDEEEFERIRDHLFTTLGRAIPVLHTICDATQKRQAEAIALARSVDFMVVVGGRESGNTRRLAKVAQSQGTPCALVETAAELPLEKMRGLSRIGLTAGASTPKKIIDAVESALRTL